MPHDIALISTIAVSLAFAFVGGFIAVRLRLPPLVLILAGLGISLPLIPEEGQHLILAAALISITLNPLLFRLAAAIRK